jgi:dTDP-4-dehydrorhamnose reductase
MTTIFPMIGPAKMVKGKVAILGGRGMLGTDLAAECGRRGMEASVYDMPEFDITDDGMLRQVARSYRLIVNCAAYTNVDGAEGHEKLANAVNADAVGRLGEMAAASGATVLHISTDFVFDGKLEQPYRESDKPNPLSVYGRTKLAGEQLLQKSGCRCCIVRVQWTYGKAGDNFVKKILARVSQGGTVKVVDDQHGSPTATTEAAKALCGLMAMGAEGLFHFAAAGHTTRFDIAKFIVEKRKLSVQISPCKTSDFVSPAQRPLNSRFDCSKILALLDKPIAVWQGPLERFVESL